MSHFTDEELLEIIKSGESDTVEFKESLSGSAPERIREAICAFANDLPDHKKPGFVFVGVRDDKTVLGLPDINQVIEQLSHMKSEGHILPPPSMTVEKHTLEGKEVAVVRVEPADSPQFVARELFVFELGLAETLQPRRTKGFSPKSVGIKIPRSIFNLSLHQIYPTST